MFMNRRFDLFLVCVSALLLWSILLGCAPATPPPLPTLPPVPTLPPAPTFPPVPTIPPVATPAPTDTTAPPTAPTVASTISPTTAASPTVAATAPVPSSIGSAPTLMLANQVKGGFVSQFGWASNNQSLTVWTQDALTQYSVPDLKPTAVVSPTFAAQIFALSPDGTKVLGLAQDQSIHVWNTADGKSVATLQGAGIPEGAAFTPDSSMVGLGSADKIEITLYDANTGKSVKTLSGFQTAAPVYSAVFAPDNKTMAWVSRGTVQFQDIDSGKLGQKLQFEDFVGAAQFTSDSKSFVTIDVATINNQANGVVQVWNVADGKMTQQLANAPDFFNGLSVSPVGTYLATATDNKVMTWNWQSGGNATSANAPWQISSVSFSPDGKWLATGDQDGNIVLWQVQ